MQAHKPKAHTRHVTLLQAQAGRGEAGVDADEQMQVELTGDGRMQEVQWRVEASRR